MKYEINSIYRWTSGMDYLFLVIKILEVRDNMDYYIEIVDTNLPQYKIGEKMVRTEHAISKSFVLDNNYKLKKLIDKL